MTTPVRLQLSRKRGFNLQALSRATNDLPAMKVDRSTRWGNPWVIGARIDMRLARKWGWEISPSGRKHICQSQTEAFRKFRHALLWDTAIHAFVRQELGGFNLACWCDTDECCHASALLFVANSRPSTIRVMQDSADDKLLDVASRFKGL